METLMHKDIETIEYQIAQAFTYHPPKDGQPLDYDLLRQGHRRLAELVVERCPRSRERSVALTKIEEACFWANASIARNT